MRVRYPGLEDKIAGEIRAAFERGDDAAAIAAYMKNPTSTLYERFKRARSDVRKAANS